MTTNYQVTVGRVADAAQSCDQTAALVEEQLNRLKSYVTSMEDYWQGVAHVTFRSYMAEWDTYAQMLHHALTGIAVDLRASETNYRESEEAALQRTAHLQGELPAARLS